MGKFDILDKRFFEDRKRFAELINREIYHDREVLAPEELELLRRKYPSMASASGEMERDVFMRDIRQNVCYGLEIESESDYSMPERVMLYDAGEYEHQIREIRKEHIRRKEYQDYRDKKSRMKAYDFLMPIVTIVLYLGEGHWEGRIRLKEMFRIPAAVEKQLDGLLRSYEFPLLEAEAIEYEKYSTDLREFFQVMQCRRNKKQLRELFNQESFRRLGRETEQAIVAHLNNRKLFERIEEGMPMCKAMEDICLEERELGRTQGKAEGIEVGKMEERFRTMQRMLQAGLSENLILNIMDCTREELAAAAGR